MLPPRPRSRTTGLARLSGAGIRYLISKRVKSTTPSSAEAYYDELQEYVDELKTMPVAEQQDAANEQHYEVPTEYFTTVLGEHRKYSSCLYSRPGMTLEEAEVEMMELTCRRAQLVTGFDGDILELGCGWGSLSLFMAQKLPNARITAISNSKTQKEYIDGQSRSRGIKNLTVKTQDVVTAEFEEEAFDRVVSIEMFEHMKNYETLLGRISSWLRPGGMLFVHIFVHAKGLVCVESGWRELVSRLSPRASSRASSRASFSLTFRV
jgi:cyclopropane-fatty-acyl-phospholipid synthase